MNLIENICHPKISEDLFEYIRETYPQFEKIYELDAKKIKKFGKFFFAIDMKIHNKKSGFGLMKLNTDASLLLNFLKSDYQKIFDDFLKNGKIDSEDKDNLKKVKSSDNPYLMFYEMMQYDATFFIDPNQSEKTENLFALMDNFYE